MYMLNPLSHTNMHDNMKPLTYTNMHEYTNTIYTTITKLETSKQ